MDGRDDRVSLRLVFLVLTPFGLGFLLSNYYRTMTAILAPSLISDLKLTATSLGLLTSIYFFATALFQLPLGLLMDRYGPRAVQATMMVLAAAGVFIFATAHYLPVLLLARAIMGIGAAGALMTSFQAVIMWFPASRWPLLNGLVLSGGGVGVLAATLPTELALRVMDWRSLMLGVAVVSLVCAVLTAAVVPKRSATRASAPLREQLRAIAVIYKDRMFLRVAPLYATTVGGTLAFQSLWAGPWLKDVAHLPASQIAAELLFVAVVQTVCYPLVGWLASALGKRGVAIPQIIAIGTGLFIVSQAGLLMPSGAAHWLVLIGMGLFAYVNLLSFPLLAQNFPATMIGRVNTALNLYLFLGVFIVQYSGRRTDRLVRADGSGRLSGLRLSGGLWRDHRGSSRGLDRIHCAWQSGAHAGLADARRPLLIAAAKPKHRFHSTIMLSALHCCGT